MTPEEVRTALGCYWFWPPAAPSFYSIRSAAVRPFAALPAAHSATHSFANSRFQPAIAGGSLTLPTPLCPQPSLLTLGFEKWQRFDIGPRGAKKQRVLSLQ